MVATTNSSSSSYVLRPEDYSRNFKQSIKSKDTFNSYNQMLKVFMRYRGIDKNNFDKLIEGINDVIVRLKEIAKFLSND
ncbi:MAG: hypothetical protein ACJ71H_00085, partial [Nitrososphaeraceae archaeon]